MGVRDLHRIGDDNHAGVHGGARWWPAHLRRSRDDHGRHRRLGHVPHRLHPWCVWFDGSRALRHCQRRRQRLRRASVLAWSPCVALRSCARWRRALHVDAAGHLLDRRGTRSGWRPPMDASLRRHRPGVLGTLNRAGLARAGGAWRRINHVVSHQCASGRCVRISARLLLPDVCCHRRHVTTFRS